MPISAFFYNFADKVGYQGAQHASQECKALPRFTTTGSPGSIKNKLTTNNQQQPKTTSMAFTWKDHNSIWKGEGIYFLTFVVTGRRKLLGTLVPVSSSRWYMENVQRSLHNDGSGAPTSTAPNNGTPSTAPTTAPHPVNISGGVLRSHNSTAPTSTAPTSTAPTSTAPNNGAPTNGAPTNGAPNNTAPTTAAPHPVNISGGVLRSHNGTAPTSTAPSPLATSSLAVTSLTPFGLAVSRELQNLPTRVEGLKLCAKQIMPDHFHIVVWLTKDTGRTIRQIGNGLRIGIKKVAIELGIHSEADGHILDIPFIRTLAHKRQLRSMIDYAHANPDNAWLRHLNPDLYVIHRDIHLAGLCFDGMGKDRLLAYPDRQVIALSRSLTQEQIAAEVARALRRAERGTVTYTAAINEGEKAVAKAIREAGFPLVVMLLKGFPPEGTEAARYFHPDGVYHRACGEGRLMLLAPKPANYEHPTLIALTDQELEQKAQAKGLHYTPLPHTTTRWRMIAGNIQLRMITEALAPSNEAPPPSTEATAPGHEATPPSPEAAAPSHEATAPSNEAPAPSTEAPAPSTEATAPSHEATPPSHEATAPSHEATPPSPSR